METKPDKKFDRISQTEMPRATLREALDIAKALRDDFAGKEASGINLAKSMKRSPTSSSWRYLTGAANAYGLTNGAYKASSISLTSLGRQIVNPTEEGEDKDGIMQALLRPAVLKNFYEKYNGSKLPKEDIAKNVLHSLGVPPDRAEEAYKILIENAKFVGIITDISGNQYIQLSAASAPPRDIQMLIPPNSAMPSMEHQPTPPTRHGNLAINTFIEDEFGVALSQNLQNKAWRNKELAKKVQELMDAAEAVVEEWKKLPPDG